MVRIRNLETGYGNIKVLKNLSLHVAPGEIVTIIGANGAGKSTLLNTIAAVLRAWQGEILFDKEPVHGLTCEQVVARGIALVPERRQVFASLSVKDNLLLGGYLKRRAGQRLAVRSSLQRVYTLFPRLAERVTQLAGTLSGGEQQMLAIGRALMTEPRLLMMDEPSLGIAPLIVKNIFQTIAGLRQSGMTILLIEQNARSALRIADRGYVMETGQIVLEGSAADLLNNRDVQRAYLGKDYKAVNE